jgi:hypothetical protein
MQSIKQRPRPLNFDEKHRLSSTATTKVASIDQKIGFSEKISVGASAVGDQVR